MRIWGLLFLLCLPAFADTVEIQFSTLPPDCVVTSLDFAGVAGKNSRIRVDSRSIENESLHFRLSKEGYQSRDLTLPSGNLVEAGHFVWPPEKGAFVKLDPQVVAVTILTSPSGAQIWTSRAGSTDDYLGVTGKPILLNLAELLGPNQEGFFRLRLTAPGYQTVDVPVPRHLFGDGRPNRWPSEGEYALAPQSGLFAPLLFSFWLNPWTSFLVTLCSLCIASLLVHYLRKLTESLRRARHIETRLADVGGRLNGSRLGPYRLYETIGKGASATVFRGERDDGGVGDESPLAIKVFHLRRDAMERLAAEVKPQLGLNHPNILLLYDWGQSGEFAYLVTDFIQGRTLREEMAVGQMKLVFWRRLVDELLQGLAYAHARGIVHGDVKPENILLPLHGDLKVLDFGFARSVYSPGLEKFGGTPGYMAPEVIGHVRVDVLSDQYSAGVVLREALHSCFVDHEFKQRESFGSLLTALSRMTEPKPDKRWEDVEEARQAVLSAYDLSSSR